MLGGYGGYDNYSSYAQFEEEFVNDGASVREDPHFSISQSEYQVESTFADSDSYSEVTSEAEQEVEPLQATDESRHKSKFGVRRLFKRCKEIQKEAADVITKRARKRPTREEEEDREGIQNQEDERPSSGHINTFVHNLYRELYA
ncbi:hypothetical protein I9W82_000498 [Candida metapsilosis]|uniref:Uncharacterized protein n=1 Tax=Candida metapsilosis TaxID=273372 RepID=A0A8H7ZGP1_9ASCO|nr:hypothetical protein I9W82_000498 [Candida metapsilosis]